MSLPERFTNAFVTTLAVPCGTLDTTITVRAAASAALQASGQFRVLLGAAEYVLVTGGAAENGLTWTVTRGVEGSTAVQHAIGEEVLHVLTAGALGGQSDAAADVPSLRTLGTGAQQAAPGTTKAEATAEAESIAESVAAVGVSVEKTRAEAAESTNATAIATEKARAETAEGTNATAIASEATTRAGADSTLTNAVVTERARAEAAEGLKLAKAANLGDLASAATARGNLGLGTAATHASTDFDTAGAAAAETAAREAAVAGEATTRTAAVAAEKARAEGAESTNAAAITAEKLRAETAEGTKASASSLATEASAREAGDAGERTRAESAEALKAPLASPALTGVPTAPTQTSGDVSTKLATTAFTATAVSTERGRAEGAEATNATAVSTEKTRAEAAEAEAVKLTGSQTVAGTKTFTSSPVVPAPAAASDAVSLEYLQSVLAGITPHANVHLATAAALPANTSAAGVLTGSSVGALTVDGTSLSPGERILVKNETTEANNGIYVVTRVGSGVETFALARASDMAAGATIKAGALVYATAGSTNINKAFWVTGLGPFTVGMNGLQWEVFLGAQDVVGSSTINVVGNQLSTSNAVVTATGSPVKGGVAVCSNNEGNGSPIIMGPAEDGYAWVADSTSALGVMYSRQPVFDVTKPPYKARGRGAEGETGEDQTAIQAAINAAGVNGGVVYFPRAPGGYYNASTEGLVYKNGVPVHFMGSGGGSQIQFGHAGDTSQVIKYGTHAISCPDSESNNGNIHRFQMMHIRGPEEKPYSPNHSGEVPGYAPSNMFGFEAKRNCALTWCNATEGFHCGVENRGDHQTYTSCQFGSAKTLYGIYYGHNVGGGSYGNVTLSDCLLSGSLAGIGCHPDNSLIGTTLLFVHVSNTSYAIYREGPYGQSAAAFIGWAGCIGLAMETIGNSFFYEEATLSTASPPVAATSGSVGGTMIDTNGTMTVTEGAGSHRVGNVQVLKILGTGGTYKLVVPANTNFAGATTASLPWNATNLEIQNALNAVIGANSALVSTVAGGQQILLANAGTLVSTHAITVETGSLTGGGAEITAPAVDPNFGPQVRPGKTTVITAPASGTFTVTVKTGAVEKTTAAMPFNVTATKFREELYALENVTPYGCVVYPISTGNVFTVTFCGSLLGTEPTVTASAGSVAAGTTDGLKPRTQDYIFQVGNFGALMQGGGAIPTAGDKGFISVAALDSQFEITGAIASELMKDAGLLAGTKTLYTGPSNLVGTSRLKTSTAEFTLMKVTGPVEAGHHLALSGTRQQAVIYPAETNAGALAKPSAGFAAMAVPSGTAVIPVYGRPCNTTALKAIYDSAGTPAAHVHLKPSTTTAGRVTSATAASDFIIGATLAAGSSEKVEVSPLCAA